MLADAQAGKTPANRIAHFFYAVIICGTLLNSKRERQPKTVCATISAHFRLPLAGVVFSALGNYHFPCAFPLFLASIFPLVILFHTSHACFGFLLASWCLPCSAKKVQERDAYFKAKVNRKVNSSIDRRHLVEGSVASLAFYWNLAFFLDLLNVLEYNSISVAFLCFLSFL